MKGIILAGGKGSRLYPMTRAVSKPLIPIYDKPMVYYPLSVLLMAGIRDIMLIMAPADCESYRRLLGDGSQFGIHVEYGVQPVARGELEITALNELYLQQGRLHVELMARGMAWLDTGTPEGMLNAAQYVEAVQSRQGLYIACPEEIAWEQGFISDEEVAARGQELRMTEYGQYLLSLVK